MEYGVDEKTVEYEMADLIVEKAKTKGIYYNTTQEHWDKIFKKDKTSKGRLVFRGDRVDFILDKDLED